MKKIKLLIILITTLFVTTINTTFNQVKAIDFPTQEAFQIVTTYYNQKLATMEESGDGSTDIYQTYNIRYFVKENSLQLNYIVLEINTTYGVFNSYNYWYFSNFSNNNLEFTNIPLIEWTMTARQTDAYNIQFTYDITIFYNDGNGQQTFFEDKKIMDLGMVTSDVITFDYKDITYRIENFYKLITYAEDLGYYVGYGAGENGAYNDGYQAGEKVGYDKGFIDGNNEKYSFLTIVKGFFDIIINVASVELFPGITLLNILSVPLILAVVFWILERFR